MDRNLRDRYLRWIRKWAEEQVSPSRVVEMLASGTMKRLEEGVDPKLAVDQLELIRDITQGVLSVDVTMVDRSIDESES